MTTHITNDWHLGAVRSGGTTPTTAYQLRQQLLAKFGAVLERIDTDLVLLGDLFDTASIPMSDLASALFLLEAWLERGYKLWGVNGNHDISSNSTKFSSFQFLMQILLVRFPEQVRHVTAGELITPEMYVIPHVANQDLLGIELAKVPAVKYLLVHANYNNFFALCSDTSLNISEAQATALPVEKIIFAHEHQARTALNGKVVIIGNPEPSSVSDCLGNQAKYMLKLSDDGIEKIQTWQAAGSFSEQDWKALEDVGQFIRVTGSATAEEAGAVVNTISKFRASAKALVITNAVSIAGVQDGQQIEVTLEQIRGFSVFEALLECLTPEEGAKIKKLRTDYNV